MLGVGVPKGLPNLQSAIAGVLWGVGGASLGTQSLGRARSTFLRGQDTSKGEKPKQFQGSGCEPKGNFVKKGALFKGSQPKGDVNGKTKGGHQGGEPPQVHQASVRGIFGCDARRVVRFEKDFEIHSDVSDFAIGGVLVQDGRPVAFESKEAKER